MNNQWRHFRFCWGHLNSGNCRAEGANFFLYTVYTLSKMEELIDDYMGLLIILYLVSSIRLNYPYNSSITNPILQSVYMVYTVTQIFVRLSVNEISVCPIEIRPGSK